MSNVSTNPPTVEEVAAFLNQHNADVYISGGKTRIELTETQVMAAATDLFRMGRESVASSRERIARYLDRAADNLRTTGLLSDTVTANAWAEAASWCRDDTIWVDDEREAATDET